MFFVESEKFLQNASRKVAQDEKRKGRLFELEALWFIVFSVFSRLYI
jgi:hypothetical protein